jgi:hypothetical protein
MSISVRDNRTKRIYRSITDARAKTGATLTDIKKHFTRSDEHVHNPNLPRYDPDAPKHPQTEALWERLKIAVLNGEFHA